MKNIVTVVSLLIFVISCKAQQELYIVIDTRDTVNIKYEPYIYYDNEYIDNFTAKYLIYKDDPAEDFGGAILLDYYPYTNSVLEKWKIRKLRTKNISIKDWKKLQRKRRVKVVDGVEWAKNTSWETIYKELDKYFYKGKTYVFDKRFATKDSVQIRGVGYSDIRAQYCD